MWAWEATPYSTEEIWRGVPEDVKRRITYTNQPVSATHNASTYPWSVLARHAREEDLVVVKLDIDTLPIEEKLIHDLLHRKVRVASEPRSPLKPLHKLVDVFFYESHNTAPTMRAYWGKDVRGSGLASGLNDSYALFSRLRELGVLAHSWI